jgi:hypothetical protein
MTGSITGTDASDAGADLVELPRSRAANNAVHTAHRPDVREERNCVEIEVTEGRGALPRRRLLRAGAGGAALSLLPFASRPVHATTAAPETTAPAPTTAPPKRPTAADVELLAAAQTLEWAAAELYNGSTGSAVLDESQAAVIAVIAEHHEAYAQALSALLGRDAPNVAAPELLERADDFTADPIGEGYELESALVATHTEVIGALQGTDAAALIASIIAVEARHGTVLADLAGSAELGDLLVDDEQPAFEVQA